MGKQYILSGLVSALVLTTPLVWAAGPGESRGRTRSTIERMKPERLEAVQRDVQLYKSERMELPPFEGYNDYKTILHAHAEDSAHTGGTRPEILEDAKQEGVSVIMLTDHYRPPRDFMDSWRGLRDGVLFIPGSEAKGFLLYPDASIVPHMDADKETLIEETGKGTGMLFLSHVEERTDHSMDGLTGMEVYNRHADANDDNALLFSLMQWVTDPKETATLRSSLEQFPDEVLATQLDYPQLYMDKWDKESASRPIVGVAANDCHHNQVFVVKMLDERTVLLGTIVDDDDEMRKVSADLRPGILEMTKGHEPGDILVQLDFDPYARSFRNVSTHVLASELTEVAIRKALANGHAYISHDWMCDATGFRFYAAQGRTSVEGIMGDGVYAKDGLELVADFPLGCDIRVLRNGEVVRESFGNRMYYTPDEPGTYRVEGWLTIDKESRPWIYSNPIYVKE